MNSIRGKDLRRPRRFILRCIVAKAIEHVSPPKISDLWSTAERRA